jgi:hypothetical protein
VGVISPEDFITGEYAPDPEASAVILFELDDVQLNFHRGRSRFYREHQKSFRMQVLDDAGRDFADIGFSLIGRGRLRERLLEFDAYVHNLEDGQVKTTHIGRRDLHRERPSREVQNFYLSFPDVKVGSIIEYTISIRSFSVHRLPEWEFQGFIPIDYSQYQVLVPKPLEYHFINLGMLQPSKQTEQTLPYVIPWWRGSNHSTTATRLQLVAEQVPAIKPEPHQPGMDHVVSRLLFELKAIRMPGVPLVRLFESWEDVEREMMNFPGFGKYLERAELLLEDMIQAPEDYTGIDEKISAAIHFVRDRVRYNSQEMPVAASFPATVLERGAGNAAEVNCCW